MKKMLRTMLSAVLIAAVAPVALSLIPSAQALENGLGRTPLTLPPNGSRLGPADR